MLYGSRRSGAGLHVCEVVGDRVQPKRRSTSQDGGRRARRTRPKAVVITNGETDVADMMRSWNGSIAGGEDMLQETPSPCLFKAARATYKARPSNIPSSNLDGILNPPPSQKPQRNIHLPRPNILGAILPQKVHIHRTTHAAVQMILEQKMHSL
jgi:hypothetical protein